MSGEHAVTVILALVALVQALVGFIVYQVFLKRVDDFENRIRSLETSNTKIVTMFQRWSGQA